MTVYADIWKMVNISERIVVEIQHLLDNMDRIETCVRSTEGMWQGRAEKEYFAKILMLRQEYEKLGELFSEFSDVLRDSAECYSEIDNTLADRIALI